MPRRALIVGLGLIGGSAGIALRARGWRVGFLDPHLTVEEARAAGAADEGEIADPDLVLLATPVDVASEFAVRSSQFAVVTSACSVMAPLRAVAGSNFVAGHPLAGAESRGLASARAGLFENKPWFLDDSHDLVDEMVRDCGGVIERVSAEEHDAAVALTSHLPQILSTALAASIDEESLRFAGSGLRTFLRLAGSDASVWAPVIDANRGRIAPHAERVIAAMREILDGDPRDAFAKAQRVFRALETRSR
ncbi:MAG TPA: prephenate dehydrogenase/arogenate dehydrogenase family protein [Thermoanaerobaculia bacterium]|nr:prephenate dehydrogenase/arogenate dehydrogenase family protein [Thermoanaerobaculia bacterium]